MSDEQNNQGQLDYSFYEKDKKDDFNVFLQNMDKPVEILVYKLRGIQVVYDSKTGQPVEKQMAKPLMNDMGINFFEGMLRTYFTPNLYMSKLGEHQANNYIIGTKKQIGTIVNKNRIAWAIKTENIRPVISLISSLVSFGLTKAKSDKEFFEKIMQAKITNQAKAQQQYNDMFGFGGE